MKPAPRASTAVLRRSVSPFASSLLLGGLVLVAGCDAAGPSPAGGPGEPTASQTQALLAYGQEVKLTITGGLAGDNLGSGAALAADASFAVLGAMGEDDGAVTNTGAAYLYTRSGTTWMQGQRLRSADGDRTINENFGQSVAVSADGMTIAIGSEFEDEGTSDNRGAVWIFVPMGGTWTLQAKLRASDKADGDHFGRSLALSADGNTLLVGAPDQDEVGTLNNGAAYVFNRMPGGTTWMETKKLLASDIAGAEAFGHAVALSGDGATALIGANAEDDSGLTDNGAAYVFALSGGMWMQQAKLLASNKAAANNFGTAVALSSSGNTALVGAENQSEGALTKNGAGYLFVRSGTAWTELAILRATDAASNDLLGASAALSSDGELALLGSRGKAPSSRGAGYVFVRAGNSYVQQAKLTASDAVNSDNLGKAAALSADGTRALVASLDVDVAPVLNAGAGYVFTFNPKANGQTCQITRECASRFCADGFCCNADCGSDDRDCQVCAASKGASADGTCTPLPSTTVCRAPVGVCDATELCTGSSGSCPADGRKSNTTVCRPAAGACDAPELCDGSSVDCPQNLLRPAGYQCKAAGSGIHAVCDPADTCDGTRTSCPASFAAYGTDCGSGQLCNGIGRCI